MDFLHDESGQGMLEYVLIIAIVALAAVGIIVLVKNRLETKKEPIENMLNEV